MGKGCRPRPYSVDRKTFETNFDRIFGGKKQANDTVKEPIPAVKTPKPKTKKTTNESV